MARYGDEYAVYDMKIILNILLIIKNAYLDSDSSCRCVDLAACSLYSVYSAAAPTNTGMICVATVRYSAVAILFVLVEACERE